MSTLELEYKKSKNIKSAIYWLYSVFFLIIFGVVYEYFSHDVYSNFMLYAFTIPLIGEVLPNLLIAHKGKDCNNQIVQDIWAAGIITLTVGSIFKGILDIYGTTSHLTVVYWIAGICFLGLGLIIHSTLQLTQNKEKKQTI